MCDVVTKIIVDVYMECVERLEMIVEHDIGLEYVWEQLVDGYKLLKSHARKINHDPYPVIEKVNITVDLDCIYHNVMSLGLMMLEMQSQLPENYPKLKDY